MHDDGPVGRVALALAALALSAVFAGPAGAARGASGLAASGLAAGAASALAGVPVAVDCVDLATFDAAAQETPGQLWAYGIAGLYDGSSQRILLTSATCADLAAIPALGGKPLGLPAAIAVFTLAHEVGHRLLGPDEATADRYGLAHASQLAARLGLRGRTNLWLLGDWIRQYAPLHDGVGA